jgi:TonB family protein
MFLNRFLSLLALIPALGAFAHEFDTTQIEGIPIYSFNTVEQRPIWQSCESLKTEEDRFKCFNYLLINFIGRNFELPDAKNRKDKLDRTGAVYVDFVIEKDGSISDVEIVKSVHPEVDEEAIRVIKSIPKMYSPALVNGNPVRLRYTIPIKVAY